MHSKNSVYRYPTCQEVIEMLVDDTNVQMVLRELQVGAEADACGANTGQMRNRPKQNYYKEI